MAEKRRARYAKQTKSRT